MNLGRYADVRAGAVIGVATTDWVDPVSVQVYRSARNYRAATRRDATSGWSWTSGSTAASRCRAACGLTGGVQGR